MNFKIIYMFLALSFVLNTVAIMQDIKKMYRKYFPKKKTWQYLGGDPSEYPGANKIHINENKRKWYSYYECLYEQKKVMYDERAVIPEALQGYEGSSVKLVCKVCLSPAESGKEDSIEWQWASKDSPHLEPVELTENIFVSPEDKTLNLYNLQLDQTGQYMCKLGDSLTAPYYLTVVNGTGNIREVHRHRAPYGPYPAMPEVAYNVFLLDTQWGPWSPCSKCKRIGRKHRFGYCTITYIVDDSQRPYRNINNKTYTTLKTNINRTITNKGNILKTTTLKPITTKTTKVTKATKKASKKEKKKKITQLEIELLKVFKLGMPCSSHILPESIKSLDGIKARTDEVMVSFCNEDCPENVIFEVKDKEGRVIEQANNSAGIYSMLQGIPNMEPNIQRRLRYEKTGYYITLVCPGNLNSDVPVQWQIGTKNVIPTLLARQSNGRIYVSSTDRINIRNAKVSDTNLYSCWQHDEVTGIIRLIVEKPYRFNFDHHFMLAQMVIVIGTFTYVFLRAFSKRQHAIMPDD